MSGGVEEAGVGGDAIAGVDAGDVADMGDGVDAGDVVDTGVAGRIICAQGSSNSMIQSLGNTGSRPII